VRARLFRLPFFPSCLYALSASYRLLACSFHPPSATPALIVSISPIHKGLDHHIPPPFLSSPNVTQLSICFVALLISLGPLPILEATDFPHPQQSLPNGCRRAIFSCDSDTATERAWDFNFGCSAVCLLLPSFSILLAISSCDSSVGPEPWDDISSEPTNFPCRHILILARGHFEHTFYRPAILLSCIAFSSLAGCA
jgi:hypothetical protein